MMGALGVVSAQDDTTLNLLYWQAPSTVNPYLSGGTKDLHAASLVVEPLARYDENGIMVPYLVDEIPTVENGGVSADLTTITWKLKADLVWSDGTPVTADDAVFSWQYCTDPAAGCSQTTNYNDVKSVEAVDAQTIKVTFTVPKPFPYGPFVGQASPIIQKAQFADCMGEKAQQCTEQNFAPVGTGPYTVSDFRANDTITYVANPHYREAGKPYFTTVVLKGGGDAESAARAVLQTSEADYAWNLQVAPQVLDQIAAGGGGEIVSAFGTQVERIILNQTNPDPALGDKRSVYAADGSNAHPFLTNPAVYKALSMAIDRSVIVAQVYGPAAGKATCNVLPAPPVYSSTNNDGCLTQDIAGANKLLDDAGIKDTDGDGIREVDGVPLHILYQTSTNAVRQATQALVKQWWSQIGVDTELRNIDAAVYFGGDPSSPDTYGKFYADVEMLTNNFDGTDPEAYMAQFGTAQISGPDNNFLSNNIGRWSNADYDALITKFSQTAKLEDRGAVAIQENDLVVQSGAVIPLVWRASVSAASNRISGVKINAWDSEEWNIADWT
ncbi:MAG: peptide ABC transporter substrate-binding protein, partial [Chloroflexota bacterium]